VIPAPRTEAAVLAQFARRCLARFPNGLPVLEIHILIRAVAAAWAGRN